MARIDVLPSIEIIRGLKGILDFYVWRGLPCVRAWPRWRPARQTDASKASALLFGAIIRAYALLANQALLAYREDALDQPRTARDLMVTGVYGNLHEASMSDFLDALIICRDSLVALTDLLNALHSVDTDELVVRTEHSVLPDGAATAAAQATQLTALQKIDDLQDALESTALDRLLVRGMDQLFSYKFQLSLAASLDVHAGGLQTINTILVPAGQFWHVTSMLAYNVAGPSTYTTLEIRRGGTSYLANMIPGLLALEPCPWAGHAYLHENMNCRAEFAGTAPNDPLRLFVLGHVFTPET